MGALISETISNDQMGAREMVEGIDGEGDDAKGKPV